MYFILFIWNRVTRSTETLKSRCLERNEAYMANDGTKPFIKGRMENINIC